MNRASRGRGEVIAASGLIARIAKIANIANIASIANIGSIDWHSAAGSNQLSDPGANGAAELCGFIVARTARQEFGVTPARR